MGDEESTRNFSSSGRALSGRVSNTSRVAQYVLDSTENSGPSRFRGREEIVSDDNSAQFVDLNDLPSDRPMSPSASLTSMESYASSILHLSERRTSFLSTTPSIPSPTSEDAPSRENSFSSHLTIDDVEYSGGPPLQTSLPETAALARLTCQQVDEMMSLVLAMIRRLDQLDERVAALVPGDVPDRPRTPPLTSNSDEFTPSSWLKGAFFMAIPVLVAATVHYFRAGTVRTSRRR